MPSDSLAHQAALALQNELADLTGARWKVEPVHSNGMAWFKCRVGTVTRETDEIPYKDVLFAPLNCWIKGQARMICLNL